MSLRDTSFSAPRHRRGWRPGKTGASFPAAVACGPGKGAPHPTRLRRATFPCEGKAFGGLRRPGSRYPLNRGTSGSWRAICRTRKMAGGTTHLQDGRRRKPQQAVIAAKMGRSRSRTCKMAGGRNGSAVYKGTPTSDRLSAGTRRGQDGPTGTAAGNNALNGNGDKK